MGSNRLKVLITGATGFVGCRLAERLVLGGQAYVKALVHNLSSPGLARLARLPVEIVLGDVLDLGSLVKAANGCDIIVHCAYGNRGSARERKKVTIEGTENVLRAALQVSARKVVYFSSSVVHGRKPKMEVVDESAPFRKGSDVYSVSKIKAERLIWRYHQKYGLPVVIFRPTNVFGPYGRMWTIRIVREIQSGAVLVNGGQGVANLVYIDNLLDAVLLAMSTDRADGEAFILTDDEYVTWWDFYSEYADMMSQHPPLRSMTIDEIKLIKRRRLYYAIQKSVVGPWCVIRDVIKYSLAIPEVRRQLSEIPWIRFLGRHLPYRLKKRIETKGTIKERAVEEPFIGKIHQNPHQLPNREMIELYTSRARFSADKAKKVLGYQQRVSFEEAMTLTGNWLRYQRLIA